MNSITKRWVRSSLLFFIVVLVLAEALFVYFMYSSYYDGVTQEVRGQIDSLTSTLSAATITTSSTDNRELILRRAVEEYEEKGRFELMLVDSSGRVVASSSGYVSQGDNNADDILGLFDPDSGQGAESAALYVGKNANGERVMAISAYTPFTAGGIVALRVVTSLNGVDNTIFNIVMLSLAIIAAVILAFVISGVYFIRSIVIPVQNVEATAAHIAQGDLNIRIENNSNDEIGRLCQTINNMAEELGRTEKMKNDFISSVSHELRTPLTSIKGWAETMGSVKNADDATYRRGVDIISYEADRLYDMVEELLDFSRMQSGGLKLAPELLDLAAEVEDTVLLEEQRAAGLDLELHFDAPELPVPVFADKNRVRQVLINVIDNAIKYSHAGGIISIEILLTAADAFVIITDEGQGISPEDLESVKVRFFKGKGAVRGSGIGLAVVDEIMTAHNGALDLTSEFGKGTEVTLRFPLHGAKRVEDDLPQTSIEEL